MVSRIFSIVKNLIVILLLLAGGLYGYSKLETHSLSDLIAYFSNTNISEKYTSFKDKTGRELSAKVLAKKTDFIVIEREQDRQNFLLNTYTLDKSSRRKVEAKKDFEVSLVDEYLYSAALDSIKVYLEYVPELNYFSCRLGGMRRKNCRGKKVDKFRTFLTEQGIEYRETTLPTTAAGENLVYLPEGVQTVPCIRVGSERIYCEDADELRKLMADAYAVQFSTQ